MMELTAATAIASLALTKFFERIGENLGAKTTASTLKLVETIQRKYPEIAQQQENGHLSYRDALATVEDAVEHDAEIAEVVCELGEVVRLEPNYELLFQALSEATVSLNRDENYHNHRVENYQNAYNFYNSRVWGGKDFDVATTTNALPKTPHSSQRRDLRIIGFYCSGLSLILIGCLLFLSIPLDLQQILVILIALFSLFSLSAFKRSVI